jgi:hypothetical protein
MAEAQKKVPALQFLVGKYGHEKFDKQTDEIAGRKGVAAEFWAYPKPGEPSKVITFITPPDAVFSDKFSRSGGVGLVSTVECDEGKCPLGTSEPQLMDIIGELKAHFKRYGWSIDLGLDILVGLSFEVSHRKYSDKQSKEERSKVSFTLLINEAYNRAIVNVQKQIEEYGKSGEAGTEESGVDITSDMFGMTPEKPVVGPITTQ